MNTFTIPEGTKEVKIDQINNKVIIEFIPQVEKFEPKDGDILTRKNDETTRSIIIYKYNGKKASFYSSLDLTPEIGGDHTNLCNTNDSATWGFVESYRFAIDSEKQLLFDKLAEQGYKWNAEEKKIEKIRWRAKKGESYWTFTDLNGVVKEDEDNMDVDDRAYYNGAYFQHKEQAEKALEAVKNLLLNTGW